MSSHKGDWCPVDENKFCQESDCKNCQVYKDIPEMNHVERKF